MSFVRVSKRFSIGYRSSRVSDLSLQGFEKGKLALTYQSFNLALWPAAQGSVSEVDSGGHGQPRRPSP